MRGRKLTIALAAVAALALLAGVAQAALRGDGSTPAPASITRLVTHVPATVLDAVGLGKVYGKSSFTVKKLNGASLRTGGKPELLVFSLAWCPHCAADSWAMAIALSRFGTLSHLREIDSGTYYGKVLHARPAFSHTKGLSFLRARYRSPYLSFRSQILQDVAGHNLQRPTRAQSKAVNAFDRKESIPAVDIGGAYGFVGSGYSPGVLAHLSWSRIAHSLADPRGAVARHVDGLANLFTAAICAVTDDQPASVCSSSGVLAAAHRL